MKPQCSYCQGVGSPCNYSQKLSWGGRPFQKSRFGKYMGAGAKVQKLFEEHGVDLEEFEKMAGELAETEAEPELEAALPETEHPSTGEGEPSTPDEELHAEASQTAEPPAVEEGAAAPEAQSTDTVVETKV